VAFDTFDNPNGISTLGAPPSPAFHAGVLTIAICKRGFTMLRQNSFLGSCLNRIASPISRYAKSTLLLAVLLASVAGASAQNLSVTTHTIVGGNNNGVIDLNECDSLNVVLSNTGAPASGISAVLSSNTPGITVTQDTSTFPNIGTNQTGANNTSYRISVAPDFECGIIVEFNLAVTTADQRLTPRPHHYFQC
jgi:hypothetical protein